VRLILRDRVIAVPPLASNGDRTLNPEANASLIRCWRKTAHFNEEFSMRSHS
jgi:hypothetical protein